MLADIFYKSQRVLKCIGKDAEDDVAWLRKSSVLPFTTPEIDTDVVGNGVYRCALYKKRGMYAYLSNDIWITNVNGEKGRILLCKNITKK